MRFLVLAWSTFNTPFLGRRPEQHHKIDLVVLVPELPLVWSPAAWKATIRTTWVVERRGCSWPSACASETTPTARATLTDLTPSYSVASCLYLPLLYSVMLNDPRHLGMSPLSLPRHHREKQIETDLQQQTVNASYSIKRKTIVSSTCQVVIYCSS